MKNSELGHFKVVFSVPKSILQMVLPTCFRFRDPSSIFFLFFFNNKNSSLLSMSIEKYVHITWDFEIKDLGNKIIPRNPPLPM